LNASIVFDSVRRGYNDLGTASNDDIIAHFDTIDPDAMVGHVSNIKGIVFEQQVVDALNEQGVDAVMFEETNHPITDIAIMSDGDIAAEMQLKATDNVSYINETLAEHPDVPIIVTSEIADKMDHPMVIDSGIDNAELTHAVTETLAQEQMADIAAQEAVGDIGADIASEGLASAVLDVAVPVSPIGFGIGLLFGLPF
jgi:thiazole synthase ThiGH ThiG subunit